MTYKEEKKERKNKRKKGMKESYTGSTDTTTNPPR